MAVWRICLADGGTFSPAWAYNPAFVRLYAKHLQTMSFSIPFDGHDGTYQRFTGDNSVPGKGEILVWQPRAS